jgi:hypothetical protein
MIDRGRASRAMHVLIRADLLLVMLALRFSHHDVLVCIPRFRPFHLRDQFGAIPALLFILHLLLVHLSHRHIRASRAVFFSIPDLIQRIKPRFEQLVACRVVRWQFARIRVLIANLELLTSSTAHFGPVCLHALVSVFIIGYVDVLNARFVVIRRLFSNQKRGY